MPDKTSLVLGLCFAALSISLTGTFFINFAPEKKFYAYRLQIGCLFIVLVNVLSRFLWFQLASEVNRSSLTGRVFRCILLLILILGSLSMILGYIFVGPEPYFITKTAFLCLGFMFIASFNVLVWNVLCHLNFTWKQFQRKDTIKPFVIVGISIIMCVSGFHMALSGRKVININIEMSRLPASLNGTKLVQLSDIHIGPTVGKSVVESVVNRVMNVQPDLIVITGDLIDTGVKSIVPAAAPLKRLKAKYGCYFVTGTKYFMYSTLNPYNTFISFEYDMICCLKLVIS